MEDAKSPEKPVVREPAPEVAPRDDVRVSGSPVRCPFCHGDIAAEASDWLVCKACLARHHAGCWGEHGACSSCGHAKFLASAQAPGRATAPALAGIAASPAKTRGNVRFALGIVGVFVFAALLGVLTARRTVHGTGDAGAPARVSAPDRLSGPHGPSCEDLDAAEGISSDLLRAPILVKIAQRPLTPHEQRHLVDTIMGMGSDTLKEAPLETLISNPALVPETRTYVVAQLGEIGSDLIRSRITAVLLQHPAQAPRAAPTEPPPAPNAPPPAPANPR